MQNPAFGLWIGDEGLPVELLVREEVDQGREHGFIGIELSGDETSVTLIETSIDDIARLGESLSTAGMMGGLDQRPEIIEVRLSRKIPRSIKIIVGYLTVQFATFLTILLLLVGVEVANQGVHAGTARQVTTEDPGRHQVIQCGALEKLPAIVSGAVRQHDAHRVFRDRCPEDTELDQEFALFIQQALVVLA